MYFVYMYGSDVLQYYLGRCESNLTRSNLNYLQGSSAYAFPL